MFSDTHGPHSSGKPRDTYLAKKGRSEAGEKLTKWLHRELLALNFHSVPFQRRLV